VAKLSIVAGATSQSINVFIQDSSSTIGAGLGAVAPAGGSLLTGTIAYYSFSGANAGSVSIALAVLATVGTAWTTAGIVTIDDTHMKGVVRLDLPNAVLAAAKGRSVTVVISGGTNMAPCVLEIELESWDNQVAIAQTGDSYARLGAPAGASVSADLAAVEANALAAKNSTAGLTFTVAGKVDADVYDWNGTAVSAPATAGIPEVNVKNIVNAAAVLDANNLLKVDVADWLGTVVATPATAGIPDVNVKNINNVSTSPVTTVKAVQGLTTADTIATYTGNTPQTGDSFARLGAPAGASIEADIAAINAKTTNLPATPASATNITAGTITTVTNLTNAPTAGDFTATMKTSIGTAVAASAVASVTGNVGGNVTGSVGSVVGNTDQTGDVYALLTGANTEVTSVPTSTDTLVNMLKWLFALARNKLTQTATTTLLRNNADGATIGTSTISDDGTTFTRGKFS
jgi:hypothetical protein